jgi:hypothetical protein
MKEFLHTRVLQRVSRAFGLGSSAGGLPVIQFENAFPGFKTARLTLERIPSCVAGVRVVELLYLAYLASLKPSMNILEIGTSQGRTTLNLALNAQAGSRIWSLDLPAGMVPDVSLYQDDQVQEIKSLPKAEFLRPHMETLPVTLLLGESTTYDFSHFYGMMDLVFIDGGHSQRTLESDTANAMKLLKPSGGLILWHDYLRSSCPAVVEFLNELSLTIPIYLAAGTKTAIYCSDPAFDLNSAVVTSPKRS